MNSNESSAVAATDTFLEGLETCSGIAFPRNYEAVERLARICWRGLKIFPYEEMITV